MTQKRGNPDQYLQKVGNTYYARVKVPRTLQRLVKQTHLRRSLKTSSRAEANLRKHSVVSEIKAELAALRSNPPSDGVPFSLAEARAFRAQLEQVRLHGDDDEVETLEIAASDLAERMERLHGTERARRWYRMATASGENLKELHDRWLSVSDYKESTKAGHRKALQEVLTFMRNEEARPEDVTQKVAINYIDHDLMGRGLAHATIRDRLVSLGGFWKWLASRGAVRGGINPWAGHKISKKQNPGTRPPKRGYTDAEVLRLLNGNETVKRWPTYSYLPDLIILGLFTGAREEELCSLTAAQVETSHGSYVFKIKDAKTKAGIRYVAVTHPAPVAVLKRRLKGTSEAAQVFPELSPGGLDDKLSSSAVKAYGRYRRACEVPDGTDFHSFRRSVVTVLEHAGVSQVSIARFVGHKVGTLAADRYSDGGNKALALEVAVKVRYGPAIEEAAMALANR
jgi:integrase